MHERPLNFLIIYQNEVKVKIDHFWSGLADGVEKDLSQLIHYLLILITKSYRYPTLEPTQTTQEKLIKE